MSYCQFGTGYPVHALSANQRHLINEFSQLGLLYLESESAPLFYPANIAINMIFKSYDPGTYSQDLSSVVKVGNEGLGGGGGDTHTQVSVYDKSHSGDRASSLSSGLRIIVETNMQVSVYVCVCVCVCMHVCVCV